jgi:hypothetical protein
MARSAEEVRQQQVAEIRQAMANPLQAVLFHLDAPPPVESPQLVDLRQSAGSDRS